MSGPAGIAKAGGHLGVRGLERDVGAGREDLCLEPLAALWPAITEVLGAGDDGRLACAVDRPARQEDAHGRRWAARSLAASEQHDGGEEPGA